MTFHVRYNDCHLEADVGRVGEKELQSREKERGGEKKKKKKDRRGNRREARGDNQGMEMA